MNVKVSSRFKKNARKTIFSIFIFGLTYIFLVSFAILLTIAFAAIGIWLIALKPMLLTFGIGIGLAISGFAVLYFLVKFIFTSTKVDRSHLMEIRESEQPQLFALIRGIVKEVDTSFPKKVYLSYDVNASVFYDSSFWSMFLPVRKNLQIGIGLMNAVTQQEFKAILAHEFGHFSQKSMKVGSYVYHVNQIIYNMLYNNDSLDKMIAKGANVSGYLTLFIGVSISIIKQIQRILQKIYEFINVNYMALSREMEFHADEIAAHVAGSKALSDSLLRLEFANHALDRTLSFYSDNIKSNLKSANIYDEHIFVMSFLAQKNRLQMRGIFPMVDIESTKRYNKSKLNIENQWASHPSNEDRIVALDKLNIVVEDTVESPAIRLLNNKQEIIEEFTHRFFEGITYAETPKALTGDEFSSAFVAQFNEGDFDEIFNDFYTFNNPIISDLSNHRESEPVLTREALFSQEYVDLTFELNALKNDLNLLVAIQNDDVKVNTFDYDGVKYPSYEAYPIAQLLEKKIKENSELVGKYNIQIFEYFNCLAEHQNQEKEFRDAYHDLASFDQKYDDNVKFYQSLIEQSRFIFEVTPFEEINVKLEILQKSEPRLKRELQEFFKIPHLFKNIDAKVTDTLREYVEQDLVYFHVDQYDDSSLEKLMLAIDHYHFLLSQLYFYKKKRILDIQKQLLETTVA